MGAGLAIDLQTISIGVLHSKTPGSYDHGKWVPGAPISNTLRGVIQPATGRQLMDVPEGVRTEANYIVWSRQAIVEDDTITYKGKDHRVVWLWPRDEDSFYRAAIGMTK